MRELKSLERELQRKYKVENAAWPGFGAAAKRLFHLLSRFRVGGRPVGQGEVTVLLLNRTGSVKVKI